MQTPREQNAKIAVTNVKLSEQFVRSVVVGDSIEVLGVGDDLYVSREEVPLNIVSCFSKTSKRWKCGCTERYVLIIQTQDSF